MKLFFAKHLRGWVDLLVLRRGLRIPRSPDREHLAVGSVGSNRREVTISHLTVGCESVGEVGRFYSAR